MTPNNGTLDNYTCSHALLLPLISEFTWPVEVRAFLYLLGLLYCFTGVAIIADIFMGAIEKITSTTRKVRLSQWTPFSFLLSILDIPLITSFLYTITNRFLSVFTMMKNECIIHSFLNATFLKIKLNSLCRRCICRGVTHKNLKSLKCESGMTR